MHQIWHQTQHTATEVTKKSDRAPDMAHRTRDEKSADMSPKTAPDMESVRHGTYGRYGKGGRFFSLC